VAKLLANSRPAQRAGSRPGPIVTAISSGVKGIFFPRNSFFISSRRRGRFLICSRFASMGTTPP